MSNQSLRNALLRVVNASNGLRKAFTLDERNYRRVLANSYLRGEGLEVGALHNPLPISTGARVRYVDRMPVAELREQYPELADKPLVEPDIIDDGEKLGTVAAGSQDFVIANHMLEHTQDPIATLQNWVRVLRDGGVLFIAVPDKRHTFDKKRPLTTFEHLVEDHERGPEQSKRAHFEEWVRLVNDTPSDVVDQEVARLLEIDYSIHFHVWDALSFQSILLAAIDKYALPLDVRTLVQSGHEIIVVLEKRSDPAATGATA